MESEKLEESTTTEQPEESLDQSEEVIEKPQQSEEEVNSGDTDQTEETDNSEGSSDVEQPKPPVEEEPEEYSDFQINQIFESNYPPEAADWCNNKGNVLIKEIEPKDGIRRFQIVAIPDPTLEEKKSLKLAELDAAFLRWYENDAVVTSSLGFVVDSDARAMMDVSGLVTTLEATPAEQRATVAFMDHDNQPHMLTLDEMKIVRLEIIKNGQSAYTQKWTFRAAIDSAEDVETLDGIQIVFKGENFKVEEVDSEEQPSVEDPENNQEEKPKDDAETIEEQPEETTNV